MCARIHQNNQADREKAPLTPSPAFRMTKVASRKVGRQAAFYIDSMFETEQFRNQLTEAIASEAGANQLTEYQTAIIAFLQTRAQQNEAILLESEMTKTASERRGVPAAIQSARTLVKAASAIARANNRTLLTEADVAAAYQANFCRVWPFCR